MGSKKTRRETAIVDEKETGRMTDGQGEARYRPLEELTIVDNFMFGAVMKDPERCRRLLEIILKIKIRKIEYVEIEKSIDKLYDSKSIRLDLYVEGSDTVYNVEMEASGKKKPLPKRTRLYQGIIDLEKLKKSFIVFICTFDPFGRERYVYTFQNRCDEEEDLLLGDDAVKIFLNAKGKIGDISSELKSLLHYIDGNEPDSDYTRDLQKAVDEIKRNEEWRREYMRVNIEFWEQQKLGEYRKVVTSIRKSRGSVENDVLENILDINHATFDNVSSVLSQHPDWDDTAIAEAVIDMEEA